MKIQTNEYNETEGITPQLAAKHAKWLVEIGADAIEISCGSSHFATMPAFRGKVPLDEFLEHFPDHLKPMVREMFEPQIGKFDYEEP